MLNGFGLSLIARTIARVGVLANSTAIGHWAVDANAGPRYFEQTAKNWRIDGRHVSDCYVTRWAAVGQPTSTWCYPMLMHHTHRDHRHQASRSVKRENIMEEFEFSEFARGHRTDAEDESSQSVWTV